MKSEGGGSSGFCHGHGKKAVRGPHPAPNSCWRRAARAFFWVRCLVANPLPCLPNTECPQPGPVGPEIVDPDCPIIEQFRESFLTGSVLGLDADSVLDALKQSL
jgi:hypothetical protein